MHRGTEPESATVIGNGCYLMAAAHVGHNCVIGSSVIICNCALLGGHVHVSDRAFISGGVVIHQFTHVGRLAMFSGNARVSMDVPPFTLAAERNEIHALNLVGLRRAKISREALGELKKLYQMFYLSGMNGTQALTEASGARGVHHARSAGVHRIRAELAEWDLSAGAGVNGIAVARLFCEKKLMSTSVNQWPDLPQAVMSPTVP